MMRRKILVLSILASSTECLNLNLFRFGRRATLAPPPVPADFTLPVVNRQARPVDTQSTPDQNIDNLFAQNQAWKKMVLEHDPDYFKRLGSRHEPKYMWIGCSDAEVPSNVIMGEELGRVFTVRNMANLVLATDGGCMAAIMFAVDYLKATHIIVCGHYDCAAIRASVKNFNHGPLLENWLRNLRDVYRLHQKELDGIADPGARHRRLVEWNVIEQSINVYKTSVIQRNRARSFREGAEFPTPRIHPCVFDPKTGDLMRLNVRLEDYVSDLSHIFDLYIDGTPQKELAKEDKVHH